MTYELKPYPSYKDCGIPSLRQVPEHWAVQRAKVFLREVDERSSGGDEELLSVSHKTGVTPRREKNVTMFLARSNVGHKVCAPGDVVINTMWAWMAAAGVAKQKGIVSPSYGVYRPRQSNWFLWDYFDELLRTPAYRAEYVARSTGITESRLRLYPDSFLRIPIVCPDISEQKAILRFVGNFDRRIRRYINAKQRVIALAGEMRQALTGDALKLAGTASLPLRRAADTIERPVARVADQIYTPVGLFNRGRGIFHKEPLKGAELGDSSFYWIEEGDLILSGQFAWEGAIALAGPADNGCVASHRYPVLRGKHNVTESGYLLAFLKTGIGQLLLDQHSRGAAGRNRPLNTRTLLREKIPIPPLPLQQCIGALVVLEARLHQAIARTVELCREYRSRLIADVVTGKVDVRNISADLPDDRPEEGTIQESEDLDLHSPSDVDIDEESVEVPRA